VFAALAGCSKKDGAADKAGTASAAAPAKAAPPAPAGDYPAEFAAWDMPARAAAWQGAWSGEAMSLGQEAAWEITGTKLHYVDKHGEKQMELEVRSPCTAKFTERSASGSESTETVYTLQDGQLITGLGSAGQRKGDQAVVCGGGKIFTLDAKGCTEWEDNFGRLKSKPGECGFAKDGDKDVFTYKAYGSETTLRVEGDVIWSEQLAQTHATKQASFDAARQAQGL
jgi:hypothetical protein